MGGEANVSFRPDLIDDSNVITDTGTRAFLQTFADRFAEMAEHFNASKRATAA
jgi:chromate reductase